MLKRSTHLLLRVLGLLASTFAVLLVATVWRLASGPLPLDMLTPSIEEAFRLSTNDLEVSIGQTELRFGGQRVVTFVLVDLVLANQADDVVLEVPEAQLDLSLSALALHGVVAPTRIEAAVSQLVLIRERDGSIGFQSRTRPAEAPEPEGRLDLQRLAERLRSEPEPAQPLSYLEEVSITGNRLIFDDRASGTRLEAKRGSLDLSRGKRVEATIVFEVPRPDRIVRVRANGEFDGRQLALDARIRNLTPGDLAPYLDRPELAGLDLPLNVQVATTVDVDGAIQPVVFEIEGRRGRIDLPAHFIAPLPIDRVQVDGTVARDLTEIQIESLVLETLGATVHGQGTATSTDGGLEVQASARANNVRVADFDRLWPTSVGQQARQWTIPNVQAGIVPDAEFQLDIRPGDLEQLPIPRTLVTGRFTFDDLVVQYLEGFPLIKGIDGVAYLDGWALAFEGGGGTSEGLTLNHGKVAITGLTVPGKYATQLHIDADVSGPVGDALSLLDREPLGFPTRLGIDPANTAGSVQTRLQLGLPLYKDVEAEVLEVNAKADLKGVEIGQLLGEVDVRDGDLTLSVGDGGMNLDGTATVQEVPLTLSLYEDFAGEAEEVRRYRIEGDLDRTALEGLGMADLGPLTFDGSVGLDLAGAETRDGTSQLGLELDLAQAALGLPLAGWAKARGAPGEAEAEITLPADGPVQVEDLLITAPDLKLDASLSVARQPLALQQVNLRQVAIGEQWFAGRLNRADDQLRIEVRGQQLVLDPVLDVIDDGVPGEDDGDELPPMSLDLAVDQLSLNNRTLSQFQLKASRTVHRWQNGDLTGVLDNGSRLKATLTPGQDGQTVTVTSEDAGAVVELLSGRRPIAGGRLTLDGKLRQRPSLDFTGELAIDSFRIDQAPTLARILTLMSARGIGDVVAGRKLAMTRLEIPFELTEERLVLDRGRTWGSGLGLTLEGSADLEAATLDLKGTVLPAYGLNWAIGKIPVLGDFLKGREGEGAFAATYSVRGPFAAPEVKVNPLSVLAPGFLRELFEGGNEPPEMPPDRDLSR